LVCGFGGWAHTPNPQSPIPNPQSPIAKSLALLLYKSNLNKKNNQIINQK